MNEPGDTKGAILAFLIIAFVMVALPITVGSDTSYNGI